SSLSTSLFPCLLIPLSPRSTLFPYTTLFRSYHEEFKIGEENHKIENQEGSYELIMFSTPVELDQYPDEEVRNLYRIYLSEVDHADRKSTRLNSSHVKISYAVVCLKKKNLLQN